jgi:hypothetical protein
VAWEDDSVLMLRYLTGDTVSPFAYTDDTFETFALVAAKRVVSELRLGESYAVDLDAETISPDPTTQGVSGESFQNLFVLLARVTVLEGEAKKAAAQAVSIKDGPSAIDLKEVAKQKAELLREAKKDYEAAKLEFRLQGGIEGNGGAAAGHAVCGPVRSGWTGYWPGDRFGHWPGQR